MEKAFKIKRIEGVDDYDSGHFLTDLMENLSKKYEQAINGFIVQFAEENQLSIKCAKYYIKRHFNLKISHEQEDDKHYIVVTPELKSPEELLYDMDHLPTTDESRECEKELLNVGRIE